MPRRLRRPASSRLAAAALTTLVLAGCGAILEGEDNGPPPDPMAAEVAGARLIASIEAEEALVEAVAALGGKVVGRASNDECFQGQNNHKVHDGYDHRCTLRRSVVVAFDGDFRRRLRIFDERMFASWWGCHRDPCTETLAGKAEEYWDLRTAEYGGPFPISRLPPTYYERGTQFLDVAYVGPDRDGRGSLERFHHRRRGGLFTSYEQAQPYDVDAVLARSSPLDYAVALAIETVYYEDRDFG